jgi:hypothetical protein
MDTFFALDKNQKIPLPVTMHLLACRKCRSQVRLLTMAEKIAAKELKQAEPLDNEILLSIMKKVDPQYAEKLADSIPTVSMIKWIAAGCIMIGALLFYGIFNTTQTSSPLTVSFYLFFAAAVTAYCAVFIGSNMDFFVKVIDKLQFKHVLQ